MLLKKLLILYDKVYENNQENILKEVKLPY